MKVTELISCLETVFSYYDYCSSTVQSSCCHAHVNNNNNKIDKQQQQKNTHTKRE